MANHGTASAYEIPQFVTVSNAVSTALPKALDGIDPRAAIGRVTGNGQALELHMRRFFAPQEPSARLIARYIVPIPNIAVNYDRKFVDAAMAGGPQTPSNYDVLKVGDLYVARHKGTVRRNITIVNFAPTVSSEQALEFALAHNLGRTIDPWECFAIGEHRKSLDRDLGFDPMVVVSLEHCEFQRRRRVPSVWWGASGRGAGLFWFGSPWGDDYWFGFVRES